MTETINVLIIENQPLIIGILKKALHEISLSNKNLSFKINIARNCEETLVFIQKASSINTIDLILLNSDIPPCGSNKPLFVDNIVIELKKKHSKTKIIVLANNCDNYKVNSILQTLEPDCVLVNTDIDFKELIYAIKTILKEQLYYSKAVLRFLKWHISNDFSLDKIDRLILYHLSRRVLTKDLSRVINLSQSGIEKRKRALKIAFNVEDGNDNMLIKVAQEKGIV